MKGISDLVLRTLGDMSTSFYGSYHYRKDPNKLDRDFSYGVHCFFDLDPTQSLIKSLIRDQAEQY